MTKTKAEPGSPSHCAASPAGKRSTMENDPVQPPAGEKKKLHRAPSPARPRDVPGWSLAKIRGGIGVPALSVKPGIIHIGPRASRRSPGGVRETKGEKKGKAAGRCGQPAMAVSCAGTKPSRRKTSDASAASDELSRDSGCAPGKFSATDSSSELSDCASEEQRGSADALSSDTETSSRGAGERFRSVGVERLSSGAEAGEGSVSPAEERSLASLESRVAPSTSCAFSDLTEEIADGVQEEFLREIEELRSENDYLKVTMQEPLL